MPMGDAEVAVLRLAGDSSANLVEVDDEAAGGDHTKMTVVDGSDFIIYVDHLQTDDDCVSHQPEEVFDNLGA
jgi:predicted RNA-binding protein